MKISNSSHFELTLREQKIIQIKNVQDGNTYKTFNSPLTKNIPELYLVKEMDAFLYVGITNQSLKTRFRTGLIDNGLHGYHGYHWKDKEIIEVYVWCFETIDTDDSVKKLENIEAELVYIIRQKTGQWPICQNEIHFNNVFSDGKKMAQDLYNVTIKKNH